MPSILEEVQPSWMTDGLGIAGQQSELNLEDETEWDTVAWSRQEQSQEDFIRKCCCPNVELISLVSGTIEGDDRTSDISICTDCIDLTDTPFGNFGSFLIYANYLNQTEILGIGLPGQWNVADPSAGAGRLDYPSDAPSPCTCPPETPDCYTTEDPTGLSFTAICLDGEWKIGIANDIFIYFYAVGITDISVPIDNQLTICGALVEDDDFGAVFTGGLGGTVTLSV